MLQEMRRKKFVLSIDPGETIGWSTGFGEEIHTYGQNDRISFMTKLSRMMAVLSPRLSRVVIERFDSRSFTNEAVDTIKLIGAIEWTVENHIMSMSFVNASDKKRFINHDNVEKLRSEGLGHAADAEAIRLWDLHYGKW